MAPDFFLDGRALSGLTYAEYMDSAKVKVLSRSKESLSDEEAARYEYTRLNIQRSIRIEKTYQISDELKNLVKSIDRKQLWVVITEDWCGDSAQNLPYLVLIAAENPKITFRILLRDTNPDIMDQYLTNGTRSIPMLIAFDYEGNELFRWGPRPKELQELFFKLRKENIPRSELYEKLHSWYTRDGGKALEEEITELIRSSGSGK